MGWAHLSYRRHVSPRTRRRFSTVAAFLAAYSVPKKARSKAGLPPGLAAVQAALLRARFQQYNVEKLRHMPTWPDVNLFRRKADAHHSVCCAGERNPLARQ